MSAQPVVHPRPKPTRSRGYPRPIGVPGPHLCRFDLSAERPAPHKCRPGSLGERDAVFCSGHEAGRRRAIGGVAALPATSARPRRWCDAGPPGRQCVTAAQKAGAEDRVRIRGRSNQPASLHHHRRRDVGATSVAAPEKAGDGGAVSGAAGDPGAHPAGETPAPQWLSLIPARCRCPLPLPLSPAAAAALYLPLPLPSAPAAVTCRCRCPLPPPLLFAPAAALCP